MARWTNRPGEAGAADALLVEGQYGRLVLSTDQVRRLAKDGYVAVPGVVPEPWLAAVDAEIDGVIADAPPPEGKVDPHFYFLAPEQLPAAEAVVRRSEALTGAADLVAHLSAASARPLSKTGGRAPRHLVAAPLVVYDGYPDVLLDMIASRTFDGQIQLVEYLPIDDVGLELDVRSLPAGWAPTRRDWEHLPARWRPR